MANDLTGEFDVVAEFTIPVANRVLAAMHRGGRVPHSWSLRVDDYLHIRIPQGSATTGSRSVVDRFGEAVTDPAVTAKASSRPGSLSVINSSVDVVVNAPKPPSSGRPIPEFRSSISDLNHSHFQSLAELERASHLNGVAELQLGAPTISPGRSSTSVVVHTPVMARYTPDKGTFIIPAYLHGEFQTTIEVQQVPSAAGNFINVKLAGADGRASFVPKWVTPAWDSQTEQMATINKALVNSLKTSFEPSSTPLPPSIPIMQFKMLQGDSQSALAIMMDVPGGVLTGQVLAAALFGIGAGVPNPASVNNVFLGEGDDFAMAVCSYDITNSFASAVNAVIPRQQSFTTTTSIEGPLGIGSYTFHTFTTVTTDDATVELQNGQILVSVQVHVHFSNDSSYVPSPNDFDFTISQAFNLALNGGQVSLQTLGDLAVNPPGSGSLQTSIVQQAKNAFTNGWNSAGGTVQSQVSRSLSAGNLQGFLRSMMNPAAAPGSRPAEEVDPQLAYTWYEIIPAGIVLHGTLEVPTWPRPHVDFSFRAVPALDTSMPIGFGEYSALRSWIPGGTIQEFIWSQSDGPPLHDDHDRFLFRTRTTSPLSSVCLTIKGSRITARGPIAYQNVSAQNIFCNWRVRVNAQASFFAQHASPVPTIALTRKSLSGGLDVVGHTSPWAPAGTLPEQATNLIVHFPDLDSLARLEFLSRTVQRVAGERTAAAIIVVLTPDQLHHAKPVEAIAFADDEKAWAHALRVQQRPATFLIDTAGDVVWQHQGALTEEEFVAALSSHLPPGGTFASRDLRPDLRIGQLVPNFVFESAPGHELTLRKLAGRPVVLVFWKSTSAASLEAVRDLEEAFAHCGGKTPVVLAINDGELPEVARKAAECIKAVIVPDPDRDIAAACGINLWPTSVYLDGSGLVTDICYGRFCGQARTSSANAPAE